MLQTVIKRNTYQDSVSLMLLSSRLSVLDHVERVSIMMGTPANKEIFVNTGLFTPEMVGAGPSDLVIVVDATLPSAGDYIAQKADEFLRNQASVSASKSYITVRSLNRALEVRPDANLALISVPGEHAAHVANQMLDHGLHTFIFSDNVSLDDEVQLKGRSRELGLLVMGPDCGTASISGIPLAFTNVVRPGPIGIVGASGTGTQEVMCQVDRLGSGVSHAIGLGGRDLTDPVGGITCLQALDALDADDETSVVVLISKPPAQVVREAVLSRCRLLSKPVVAVLLGERPARAVDGNVHFAHTLEESARVAVSLAGSATSRPVKLAAAQRTIRGLFCGGTLANEAAALLADGLGIPTNPTHESGRMLDHDGHRVIDLGDDAYTLGRPHPMIDPSLRMQLIAETFDDPTVAVLLLDVVLGYGANADPGGVIAPVISAGSARAAAAGRHVVVVASICGTSRDPQNLGRQEKVLEDAGVTVLPNNASAVAHALSVIARRHVTRSGSPSSKIQALLQQPPVIVNVGLSTFADDLQDAGTQVVQYKWSPPAGGDSRLQRLLAALS